MRSGVERVMLCGDVGGMWGGCGEGMWGMWGGGRGDVGGMWGDVIYAFPFVDPYQYQSS